MMPLDEDLSYEELTELEQFLASARLEETSLEVFALDGFFAALALGPNLIRPSQWVPWIWDQYDGEISPEFENLEEANRVMSLVMRLYNSTVRQLRLDPASFEPVYPEGDLDGAATWCEGFLRGTRFDREEWAALMQAEPAWLTPFFLLSSDLGLDLVREQEAAEPWLGRIVPSLTSIHGHWVERRRARPEGPTEEPIPSGVGRLRAADPPRAGRNEPCPCGSGKKFKKCCGASPAAPR